MKCPEMKVGFILEKPSRKTPRGGTTWMILFSNLKSLCLHDWPLPSAHREADEVLLRTKMRQ